MRVRTEAKKNGLGSVGRSVNYKVIEDLGESTRVAFDVT